MLAAMVATAGIVSAIALFNALLMAYSRIPLAMARDGLLPPSLAVLDRRDNPARAVLVSAVCYSIFAVLPFGQLVVADVFLYSLALALEYAALIRLRTKEPELRGAFRVPVGMKGLLVLIAIPTVILIVTIGLNFADGKYGAPAVTASLVAAALGPLVYYLRRRSAPAASS
jgi:amino acid transporter